MFAGLSANAEAGDAILVVGPNGAGKSSLLRVLTGLTPAFAGSVRWQGRDVRRSQEDYRAAFRYVGHADVVQPSLSVIGNLAYWAGLYGAERRPERLAAALDGVGLASLAQLPARLLSAGQRRRLALSRLTATATSEMKLWFLDEPTIALDAPSIRRVEGLIRAFRAEGGIVVASTNAPFALPDATRLDVSDFAVEAMG